MLHERNHSTFSQVLLSYLLGLYLIGFSWHLYVHTQGSFHSGDLYTDSIAVSEDACAACEWLTHHHFTLGSSPVCSFLLLTDFIDIQQGLPADYFFQSVYQGSSRAPPFAKLSSLYSS